MRVVSWKILREFSELHADAAEPLRESYRVAELANWTKLTDVRQDYRSADLVGDRLVFNIKGNKYRLICRIRFDRPLMFVRWIGTHSEYDRIDVKTV